MNAEDRTESPELEPPDKHLPLIRIGPIGRLPSQMIPADIGGPIRYPGSTRIEPLRDLVGKIMPGTLNVRRPKRSGIALLAGKRLPRKEEGPLTRNILPPAAIHPIGVHERIRIKIIKTMTGVEVRLAPLIQQRTIVRLALVDPPGIPVV